MVRYIRLWVVLVILYACNGLPAKAQYCIGTTGLLHLPTADMQKEKTFMFGGGYLNKEATPGHWYYDTYNYYINVTFFDFLEISYDCTLFSGEHIARDFGLEMQYVKKWANQDRNFSFRLRAIKEGQFWDWMPQVVIGANDALHQIIGQDDSGSIGINDEGNGYWGKVYVAATKHINIKNIGNLGVHVAGMYNNRADFLYKGVGVGADMQVNLPETGSSTDWLIKAANSLDVMAEYDTRAVNVGLKSSVWNDRISVLGELYQCKYPSVGVQFKVTLK